MNLSRRLIPHRLRPFNNNRFSSTMRAIQISQWGQSPSFTSDFPNPPTPPADSNLVQVKVVASGLHNLIRGQITGTHYSTTNATLPYIPGADGVGTTPDGSFVYFNTIGTGGGFAEYVNVPKMGLTPIPLAAEADEAAKRDTLVRVAALVNPTMSSWMALRTRTALEALPKGFTLVILGATSLSGKVAVPVARELGAGKIIGVARNTEAMKDLGLDQIIKLETPAAETKFKDALQGTHVDVVLDYLFGDVVNHLFEALPANPMQADKMQTEYVQIGSMASMEGNISAASLRGKNIIMRGSGPGSWSIPQLGAEIPKMLSFLVKGVGEFGVKERKLEDVTEAFGDSKTRSVFVP